MIKLNKTWIL